MAYLRPNSFQLPPRSSIGLMLPWQVSSASMAPVPALGRLTFPSRIHRVQTTVPHINSGCSRKAPGEQQKVLRRRTPNPSRPSSSSSSSICHGIPTSSHLVSHSSNKRKTSARHSRPFQARKPEPTTTQSSSRLPAQRLVRISRPQRTACTMMLCSQRQLRLMQEKVWRETGPPGDSNRQS